MHGRIPMKTWYHTVIIHVEHLVYYMLLCVLTGHDTFAFYMHWHRCNGESLGISRKSLPLQPTNCMPLPWYVPIFKLIAWKQRVIWSIFTHHSETLKTSSVKQAVIFPPCTHFSKLSIISTHVTASDLLSLWENLKVNQFAF